MDPEDKRRGVLSHAGRGGPTASGIDRKRWNGLADAGSPAKSRYGYRARGGTLRMLFLFIVVPQFVAGRLAY